MNAVFFGDLITQQCSPVFVQQGDTHTSDGNWDKGEERNNKIPPHIFMKDKYSAQ